MQQGMFQLYRAGRMLTLMETSTVTGDMTRHPVSHRRMCNMAAVNLKLSSRDAGYLIQMLDAVAAASRDIEPTKCSTCLGNDGRLDVPCKRCDRTGFLPHSVEVKRAQALRNAGPFGDFKSNRTFALRMGATLLSAKNIADAHSE